MEFDPERRMLIETVLEPLERRDEARVVLEQAMAPASSTSGPVSSAEIAATTSRLRSSSDGFVRWPKFAAVSVVVTIIIVLWAVLLRPGAQRDLSDIGLAGRISYMLQWFGEEPAPFLPGYRGRFRPFDLDDMESVFAICREAHRKQSERANHTGSITQPPFELDSEAGVPPYQPFLRAAAGLRPEDPAATFRANLEQAWDERESGNYEPLLQECERLDPDNGITHLLRAIILFRESTSETSPAGSTLIRDKEGFSKALQEMERASNCPRWDDYRQTLWERESSDWPQARDYPEQIVSTVAYLPALPNSVWLTQPPEQLLAAQIEKAAKSRHPSALDGVAVEFDSMRYRWANIATNYKGRTLQCAMIREGAKALRQAYAVRGATDQVQRYDKLAQSLMDLDDGYPSFDEMNAMGFLQFHILHSTLPVAADKEPAAGRMAEYAMWERFSFHFLAVVLAGVSAFLAGLAWFARREGGELGARLTGVLGWRDRLWILFGGIGVPVLVYLLATRLMPGRNTTMLVSGFLLMLDQVLSMVGAMVFGSAFIANRLLVKHGRALGFRKGFRALDGAVVIYFLCSIILCALPFGSLKGNPQWILYCEIFVGLQLLLPAFWIGARFYRAVSTPAEVLVLHAAQIRACVPGICLAAVLAAGSTFALHAWESRLVGKMTLGSVQDPQLGFASPEQMARAEKIRQALAK